ALSDHSEIVEGVLAREHDTLQTKLLENSRARLVVDGHLRRAVNLELRIELPDEANETEVLDDDRVDAAVDRLDEDVQREIDAASASMCEATRFRELVECELRTFVAGVESLCAEIHGVRAV